MHGLEVSTPRLRSFDAYELTMDRPGMLIVVRFCQHSSSSLALSTRKGRLSLAAEKSRTGASVSSAVKIMATRHKIGTGVGLDYQACSWETRRWIF